MSKSVKNLKDFLNQDDYWMGMAFWIAAGSSSSVQQGAVIINVDGGLVSMSGSGTVKVADVHAEINALLAAKSSLQDATIILTHTPCYSCLTAILASQIKRIVYFPTNNFDESCIAAVQMSFAQAIPFRGNLHWMRDYIKSLTEANIFRSTMDK